MFQLTKTEWESLRLQIETSNGRGGNRYLPYAFTEQGVAMLSGILNSDKAIDVNIAIMRSFIALKQFALTNTELNNKLKELENTYNKQFKDVYEAINYLLQKDKQETNQKERKQIGYKKKLLIFHLELFCNFSIESYNFGFVVLGLFSMSSCNLDTSFS